MLYWVIIQKHNKRGAPVGDPFFLHDDFIDGLVPDHVLEMMICLNVRDQLGLCGHCGQDTHCHVIEHPSGRKYCPILFHDAVKPASWRVEDLL